MRWLLYTIVALVVVVALVLVLYKPTNQIATEIEINAPPERVWAELTNFADYPKWNPFIRNASGELKVGSTLTVEIGAPGKDTLSISPTVLAVTPNTELSWRGALPLGSFVGEHSFRLEPTASGGTRFLHSEKFNGALVGILPEQFWADTRTGFDAMNAAIKQRSEAPKP